MIKRRQFPRNVLLESHCREGMSSSVYKYKQIKVESSETYFMRYPFVFEAFSYSCVFSKTIIWNNFSKCFNWCNYTRCYKILKCCFIIFKKIHCLSKIQFMNHKVHRRKLYINPEIT